MTDEQRMFLELLEQAENELAKEDWAQEMEASIIRDLEKAPMLPLGIDPAAFNPPADWLSDNTVYPPLPMPVSDSELVVPY